MRDRAAGRSSRYDMEAAVPADLHRTNFQFVRLAPVRAGEVDEHLHAPVALVTGPDIKVRPVRLAFLG